MKPTTTNLLENLNHLLLDDQSAISILANASAWLNENSTDVNSLGFYLFQNNHLYLGPFQGKPACNFIPLGQGVCGVAAFKKETVIVPDTSLFPGYIACDPLTKSELVIPIIVNNTLFGVLDIDSPKLKRFTKADVLFFEQACRIIAHHLAKLH